jgi:hypothetical protein
MNDTKYIGLDVHQATISAAVLDSTGKLVMGSILETKAATVLQFVQGLRGSLQVTLEEGTCAAWLHAPVREARSAADRPVFEHLCGHSCCQLSGGSSSADRTPAPW